MSDTAPSPAPVQIFPFAPRHAEAWRRLNETWIARHFALEAKDRLVLDDPQGQLLDRGGRIFMAELDGEAVGCVALLAMEDGGFEVAKMAVADHAQGRGVGRRLLSAAIEAGRAAGAPRLYLESNSVLTPALSLYRSAGFLPLPPRPTPYARCDVWMELPL